MFSTTSRNIKLENSNILSAECKNLKGDYIARTLNLDQLFGNINGHFVYCYKGYSQSARNVELKTAVLYAELKDLKGDWIKDSINLDEYIKNVDGNLVYDVSQFSLSSRNIRLEGSFLLAECKDRAGNYQPSKLDLDTIFGNIDGKFVFGYSLFSKSAQDIKIEGGHILKAKLKKKNNVDTNDASVDLDTYVANINGRLVSEMTHVYFTGGAKEMEQVLQKFYEKNPNARVEWSTAGQTEGDAKVFYFYAGAGPDESFITTTYNAEVSTSIFHYVNSKGKNITETSFDVIQGKISAAAGLTYLGAEAKLYLISARASVFDLNLGIGVTTEAGIKDDSAVVKVGGIGFSIGRRMGISVLDNEIAVDFGRCCVM